MAGDGDGFRVPFQEAIDYQRQKVRLPTRTWRDITGRAHDRAFVVASAMKDALLADLQKAVMAAHTEGIRVEEFAKRFEDIVARHGWTGWTGEDTPAGRAWRARVIYETNLRTSQAAGRYAQMTHPDMVRVRPYWQYRHGEHRTPLVPRRQHLAWDGLVLRWDDPFWRTHYPPNGWMCSCGVRPLSRRGLKRLGKEGPDDAPSIETRAVRDPVTGRINHVPVGIDEGWDHAPGRDWAEGLVPPPLQQPLEPLRPDEDRSPVVPARPVPTPEPNSRPVSVPAPEQTPVLPMPEPRPFTFPVLPPGEKPEEYARSFLQQFGGDLGRTVLWRDKAGHAMPISEDLFRRPDGSWKADKRSRGAQVLRLAETLIDPDEIWVQWARFRDGRVVMKRGYLRRAPDNQGFVLFDWARLGWYGTTAFPPENADYLERQRHGALLWRRQDDDAGK